VAGVNPGVEVVRTSALTGLGVRELWLRVLAVCDGARVHHPPMAGQHHHHDHDHHGRHPEHGVPVQ
jgi:hydrogenase nickel incorporation protein HypB